MNLSPYLENIFRQSINEIKFRWGLPDNGFIAGGSIANLIWNKVHGKNAPINDIDVFILNNVITKDNVLDIIEKQRIKRENQNMDKFTDYSDLYGFDEKSNSFYFIDSVEEDGIFNKIEYMSNSSDPYIVIDSFDINCCQVGYNISEDKFYFTPEFKEFILTGELKVTNLRCPAHTAIRLVKKKIELDAKLYDLEFDIVSYIIKHMILKDQLRFRFMDKYANMFSTYNDILSDKFTLQRNVTYGSNRERNVSYGLVPKNINIKSILKSGHLSSKDFLNWARNIYNTKIELKFNKILYLVDFNLGIDNYLDDDIDSEMVTILSKMVDVIPNIGKNLKGLTLSNQLSIISKLIRKFSNDLIIAVEILDKYNFSKNKIDIDDELTIVLMELGVRKEILTDSYNKVNRIFNSSETTFYIGDSTILVN